MKGFRRTDGNQQRERQSQDGSGGDPDGRHDTPYILSEGGSAVDLSSSQAPQQQQQQVESHADYQEIPHNLSAPIHSSTSGTGNGLPAATPRVIPQSARGPATSSLVDAPGDVAIAESTSFSKAAPITGRAAALSDPEGEAVTTDYQAFDGETTRNVANADDYLEQEIPSTQSSGVSSFFSKVANSVRRATSPVATVGRKRSKVGDSFELGRVSDEDAKESPRDPDTLMKVPPFTPSSVPKTRLPEQANSSSMVLLTASRSGDKDEEPKKNICQRLIAIVCSSSFIFSVIFLSMAAGLAYGAFEEYDLFNQIDWDEQLNVAFAGSSYLFVNDVPRLLETIADGQVIQDSCLHAGGSLAALLMTGNGMYKRWQTNSAIITTDNGYNGYSVTYDFGACTVHQMLTGEDEYLEYDNDNKQYYNDGNNPCIMDYDYYTYATNKYENEPPRWDYVVLADQSKRMASADGREDTVDALVSVYGPLLREAGAIPIVVDTHAFWSSKTNMTGYGSVPEFSRMIYEGVEEYVDALASELEDDQEPIVLPIGVAYLTIWEEDYDIWTTLFLGDEMHASIYGSYLFACVLYCQLFGHLPKKSASIPDHIEYLFSDARKTFGQSSSSSYATLEVAGYLQNIAKRVVLKGHRPQAFYPEDDDDGNYSNSSKQWW